MKKIMLGIIASFLSVFITLFAIEIIFRFISVFSEPPPSWSTRPQFYFGAEENPELQNNAYQNPKPENEFRIAVIGDSYTYAPYMQFTDAFPAILERMLNLNKTEKKVRVINYGVPAYSTSHEIKSVEKALSEGADLILLQITLNDAELKPYTPTGLGNFQDKFGPFDPQGKLKLITTYWKSLRWILERLHNAKTFKAYSDYFNDLFMNQKTWKPFQDSLTAIFSKASASKVPVYSFVLPLFGVVINDEYPFHEITNKINASIKERNLPVTAFIDPFKNIPTEILQVIPGGDRHPNEIGHRIIAEELYLWLLKEKALPDFAIIKNTFSERIGIKGMKEKKLP